MKENKRQSHKKTASQVAPVDKRDAVLDDLRQRLAPFRGQIDALDDKIMALLAKRFAIVRKVGQLKAVHNFPSYISDRVIEVRERNATAGEKYGIDPDFIRMLYSLIIYQSCAEEDIIKHAHRQKSSVGANVKKKAARK